MSVFFKKKSNKKNDDDWKKSGISRKIPIYRNKPFVTTQSWLYGKNIDDEAEGLWRIYNTLYDLTPFINKHPGGSYWLEKTKGTDITEAFETHHIKGISPLLLEKYKVREAKQPRNYTLTMHEHGFYKTLKRRVAETLKDLDYSPKKKTFFMHLGLLTATLVCSVLSTLNISIIFELLAALSLCWLSIAAHNYFHQRDNWQMYTFNLTLMNFAEWRISHALSHHIYTNSLYDLELSLFEPFLCWVPNERIASKVRRIISVIIQPIFYAAIFPFHFLQRAVPSIFVKNQLFWHDIIGFTLPILMLLFSKLSVLDVILQWLRIVGIGSFLFALIGANASHHTPEIYHDGDAIRKDRDWGLYQLDTIIDRGDIKGSQFMVLTHFGEHALHHLFPTLDHGVLPQLYPIFLKTLEEFKEELRECTFLDHIIGQNKQLLRTKPNPVPPCQRTKRELAVPSIFVKNQLFWHDIIGFTLPILMLLFSKLSVLDVILQWLRIVGIGSFLFALIGANASHHTPEIYHDGDAIRKDRDWGLYQLDTIIDRGDIKGSQFMVLTHFGEHALHHLFPTLDHGVLPQLYPIFLKTLEEFKEELRECTFLDHIIGQNKQLLRTKPNPVPPCQRTKREL